MKRMCYIPVEFHLSREARDRYRFAETLFSMSGRVLFADFHSARLFAGKMNKKRDLVNFPEEAVRAGHINAMGLIDEVLHYVIALFREKKNPKVMEEAEAWIARRVGAEELERTLLHFVDAFPPVDVYKRNTAPEIYLKGKTEGVANRLIALEEMLVLWITNVNPACAPFRELFDDTSLEKETAYRQISAALEDFFKEQPLFGPRTSEPCRDASVSSLNRPPLPPRSIGVYSHTVGPHVGQLPLPPVEQSRSAHGGGEDGVGRRRG